MILAHQIALDPTAKQRQALVRTAGVARFVFNLALAEWKRQYEAGERPNALALKKEFNAVKGMFPFVLEVTKCAAEGAFANLQKAFQNFFRRVKAGQKPGYPRFKKRGRRDSFGVANDKFRLDGRRVRLPRIGWVWCREALRFSGKIMGAVVSRQADRWFISIQVDVGAVEKAPRTRGRVVGVDLGLTTFATVSDGRKTEKVEAPKPLKAGLKRLRRAQRVLSRRQKGSRRRERARRRVARMHRRVADVRNDFLHKLTTRLARTTRAVVVEDLNTKGMVKNRHLARAISDAGWGEFRRQLEYKTRLHGSRLIVVDRWFPSSKTCSGCGSVKTALLLSERQYACEQCGLVLDRDENAALNIRTLGLRGNYARGPEGSGARKSANPRRAEAGTAPTRSHARTK